MAVELGRPRRLTQIKGGLEGLSIILFDRMPGGRHELKPLTKDFDIFQFRQFNREFAMRLISSRRTPLSEKP